MPKPFIAIRAGKKIFPLIAIRQSSFYRLGQACKPKPEPGYRVKLHVEQKSPHPLLQIFIAAGKSGRWSNDAVQLNETVRLPLAEWVN